MVLRKMFLFVVLPLVLSVYPVSAQDNSEIAAESVSVRHQINLFMIGGRPLNKDDTRRVNILVNHGYAVGYSEDRRNPLWSAYRASKLSVGQEPFRFERAKFFFADTRSASAVDGRTFGGGFDRGHMTPNFVIARQYGSLAQLETFFMTNMCPQKSGLNQGTWANLEKFVVDAAQKFEHVFVIAGPIFGDNPPTVSNGADRKIQIPEAFYMILADASFEHTANPTIKLLAYRFPQNTAGTSDFTDRAAFGVSVNQLEEETKLDFFPEFGAMFSNWEQKENVKEMTHWSLN